MLDKELIKKKFIKSIKSYDENAAVQKKMAKFLAASIKGEFENVLEIGSYTGFLTKEIIKKIDFKTYLALDIVDSFDCIKNLDKRIEFQKIGFEEFKIDKKFDLIAANASLQWMDDFKIAVDKINLLKKANGRVLISTFGTKNLFEIKDIFNSGLNYLTLDELKKYFPDAKIVESVEKIKFKNSIDILRHLKKTGVNSLNSNNLTYYEIKKLLKKFEEKYDNVLTYNPIYIIS